MNYLGIQYEMKNPPVLDPGFIPFGIWAEAYLSEADHPISIAVEREDGKIHEKNPGIYGGPAAGLSANQTLSWISGSGTLFVRRSALNGTMLIVR